MQLPACAWRGWEETETLIRAFDAAGAELRFVGGCVRDAFLGREVTDVDAATPATPDAVTGLLQEAGIRAIPTGIVHGTVTALINGKHFEITTLRKDVACDGRHAEVEYTADWAEDAARRDFTINALYAAPDGEIFDYADGLGDMEPCRVRFIGNPASRIREDGLRILRFYRFAAQLGVNVPDAEGQAACAEGAALLEGLSGERIASEMLKLLAAPVLKRELLGAMREANIFPHIMLPEAPALLVSLQLLTVNPLTRLAGWLMDAPGQPDRVAERWKLSALQRRQVQALLLLAATLRPDMPEAEQKAALRKSGRELFAEALALAEARDGRDTYAAMHALMETWPVPAFPVTGADLMARGYVEGKPLGDALKALEARWEAGDYAASKEELLNTLPPV